MVHAKAVLLNQLLANANDRSWYASFQESAEGISDEEAYWKPVERSHSIAEIVQHLIYWNEVWQLRYERFDVNAVQTMENNEDSFLVSKDRSFSELKKQLLKVLLRWQELITEEKIEASVNGFPVEAERWGIIGNAATHNAYHIGQIAYIRKMKK